MEFILMLDNAILNFVQLFSCAFLDAIMPLYSSLGNGGIIYIIIGIILVCFAKTRRTGAVMLVSLVLCFLLGNVTLKPLVARVRPYDANSFTLMLINPLHDFSFPSGHTFSAVASALSVYFYNKKAGVWAIVAAAVMAFSRLYLYVHYPSDIIGGALVGIACAYAAKFIVEKLYSRRKI